MITFPAPPKINLTLRITGKRADGYHLLESLVVFGNHSSGDQVSYRPAAPYGLDVLGAFAADVPHDERNLILKIAQLLRHAIPNLNIGRFTLTKRLPVASGIGGGTMDAIAALRCLQQAHDVPAELCVQIATQIGADGAACWHGAPLIMHGIGEEIEPISLPVSLHIALINPLKPVPTAAVFGVYGETSGKNEMLPLSLDGGGSHAVTGEGVIENVCFHPHQVFDHFLLSSKKEGIIPLIASIGNDLQSPALKICPEIADVLAFLQAQSVQYAAMSGSGGTCFGLFETAQQAHAAIKNIPANWWGVVA